MISDHAFAELIETRARRPEVLAELARARKRRDMLDDGRGLFLITADDAARGSLQIGSNPVALGDRRRLLDRLVTVLDHDAVDGIVATPDVVDDLLLLGALHDKVVFGSMNRSGLSGSPWEVDDRFTAFDVGSIVDSGFDGGKMSLRVDWADAATNRALANAASAVSELGGNGRAILLEVLPVFRDAGRTRIANDPEALIRAVSVASGLGTMSAFTWLKLPVVRNMRNVFDASTMPILIAGGDPGDERDAVVDRWKQALAAPQVRGFVAGRTVLFPADGDMARAVGSVAEALGR